MVILGRNFFHGLIEIIAGDAPLLQMLLNLAFAPALDAELTARKSLGKSLLIELVLAD